MEIEMTSLDKTWILDLDGTILKHNGYLIDGMDSLLDGAEDLLSQIKDMDMVIFVTSRKKQYKNITEEFLKKNNIRYNHIIYEAPYGERILINDRKTSGRDMAFAISTNRDIVEKVDIVRNNAL